MAVIVTDKKGRKKTLYNPAERASKYASDLKYGSDTVKGTKLSNTQKAFRSGYLKARKDSAEAWKSSQKKRA